MSLNRVLFDSQRDLFSGPPFLGLAGTVLLRPARLGGGLGRARVLVGLLLLDPFGGPGDLRRRLVLPGVGVGGGVGVGEDHHLLRCSLGR